MFRFLIYIAEPYGIPIGLPLQHEIESRGWEVAWFSELENSKTLLPPASKLINSAKEVMDFKPHFVLAATNLVPDFFPGIKVQIFHGFSVNKRSSDKGHFRIRGLFDLYTTHGPSTTAVFKELANEYRTFEVIETGWPKVDPLFKTSKKKKEGKPVVMISSTFTARLSLAKNPACVNEIERLKNSGKYQFICVLHPKLDEETKERFRSFENENFKYFDTTDLIPLFQQADIMLSDTTSAITEFQLLEKPVVTFRNNKPQAHFINVLDAADIEKSLDLALSYPKELIEKIKAYNQHTHPYTDGESSKRVIDACLAFYHADKTHLKAKPLNLLRMWQIRRKLDYFTLSSNIRPSVID